LERPEPPSIVPGGLPRLTGSERFSNGDSVLDFWRWALGDLRMNNARGYLAEYLVARAVGAEAPIRTEWAGWDVETPDGTRIEVKSSGYLQSWRQARPSRPTFQLAGVYRDTAWDERVGTDVRVPGGRVHVWVFALHSCREPDLYDPLDVSAWRFWTVPHATVAGLGQKSASLSTIERLASATSLDGVDRAVAAAREPAL
jgi:hypothetical protein